MGMKHQVSLDRIQESKEERMSYIFGLKARRSSRLRSRCAASRIPLDLYDRFAECGPVAVSSAEWYSRIESKCEQKKIVVDRTWSEQNMEFRGIKLVKHLQGIWYDMQTFLRRQLSCL